MNSQRFGFRPSGRALAPLVGLLLLLAAPSAGLSQDGASPFQRDATDAALDRAIDYLIDQQGEDGAIADRQHDTTMTSLAIMAMASVGVQPSDPSPRGRAMRKALDFVLDEDHQNDDGYFGQADGSRMYGHGITSLMLTEMLGMGADERQDRLILERLEKALELILRAQQHPKPPPHRGGWRYTPNASDADLSVSIWQLMALRSAKNDGLEIPSDAIDQAVGYLERSFTSPLGPDGEPREPVSGFSYVAGQRNATYTMTSAGLLAMQVCGQYDSPLVAGATEWLLEHPPKWGERYFFYGTYYYAQGMHQRGEEHAATARRLVEEVLLPRQQDDGAWVADGGEEQSRGRVYATTLAVLSLSVKYHYLPIYQR